MTVQDAIFPNLTEAMRFVTTFRHDGQARPAMNKASEPRVIGYEDTQRVKLTGDEGAAQRAFLMETLREMPQLYLDVLLARYTPMHEPCCRCGHDTFSQDWIGAVQRISDQALHLEIVTSHTQKRQGRDGAVRRYFGDDSRTLAAIAEEAEIALRTMMTVNARISAWLNGSRIERQGDTTVKGRLGIEQHALKLAETLLARRGHIRSTRHI